MNETWVYYGDTQSKEVAPGVSRKVLAHSAAMMGVEITFATGAVGEPHTHPHEQITYVQSGRFRFTIGDETHDVTKGDSLYMASEVPHGCVCLESGVLIDFFTPMREDFV